MTLPVGFRDLCQGKKIHSCWVSIHVPDTIWCSTLWYLIMHLAAPWGRCCNPLYRWGTWDTEKLGLSPEVRQCVSGRFPKFVPCWLHVAQVTSPFSHDLRKLIEVLASSFSTLGNIEGRVSFQSRIAFCVSLVTSLLWAETESKGGRHYRIPKLSLDFNV